VIAEPEIAVALAQVRFSPRAWPRQYLDNERLDEFVALYQEDLTLLPAVELVPDGQGRYLIGDGVHRVEAARQARFTEILATFVAVPAGADPVTVAYLHGLRRSAISAKPLTRAEKRAAIRRLLEMRPDASDREIARTIGVDHKTVGRLRRGDSPREVLTFPVRPRPEKVAAQLYRALEKAYEARGLGIADFFNGDRTGERLAGVLTDVYADRALEKAEQFRGWLDAAAHSLAGGR
jgi:hypothetical protein